MAIAKNLAAYGVWGVTPYQFSSSSSSIIWPLLLSLIYRLFGPHETAPLILNVLFATLTLWVAHSLWRRLGLPPGYALFGLLGMIFLTPLPPLVLFGMEHVLQVVVTIAFVYLAAGEIAREGGDSEGSTWLWALAALGTLVRYEALFVALPVCLLFLLRRRWRYAFGLGAATLMPVVVYGAVALAHGWSWLPTSILLKGNVSSMFRGRGIGSGLILTAIPNYGIAGWSLRTAHVLSLVLALLVLFVLWFYKERRFWKRSGIMVAIFVVASVLHLRFAGVFALSGFARYEAYLLALGIFVAVAAGYDYTAKCPRPTVQLPTIIEVGAACVIFFPIAPMWHIAFYALKGVPSASRNIYEQDYQMGLFLGRFYRGVPVAVNDIGAVSYLGDTRVVDLQGLANLDVAKERSKGFLSEKQIDQLTKANGVRIAILYDRLFGNGQIAREGLPPEWVKVGEWRISNNVICWDDRVSFFAVDPSEKTRLIEALRQFARQLPADVQQAGDYTLRAPSPQAAATGKSEPYDP
ncbi:MAG TPA: hypothetical protein VG204_06845 [Terriglobia bacterium]|nr:hypothetical protein [Terriglobia bacterium]